MHSHIRKYQELGLTLQKYRKQTGENVTVTSRKLGIERSYLSRLENGHEKPSLSLLNKLISYYSVVDIEATILSALAGYEGRGIFLTYYMRKEVKPMTNKDTNTGASPDGPQINLPGNLHTLYSDSVFLNSNDYGITFNFAQSMGPTNQQNVVSRVGMSREHAKVLLDVLGKHLAITTSNPKKQ